MRRRGNERHGVGLRTATTRLLVALGALATVVFGVGTSTADARADAAHSGIQPFLRTGVGPEPARYPIGIPNWYEPSMYQPPGKNALPGYTLSYSQDFRFGGKLPTGWIAFTGQPGGDPGAEWLPSHVAVKDGMLELTTTRNPNDQGQWISGGVCDCGEPATYGAYFVRSRVTGPGPSQVQLLWPANNSWPPEVDFSESWGDTNEIQGTDHYGTGSNAAESFIKVNLRKWHTFGIVWTPSSMTYIVDGRAWWTFSVASEIPNIAMTLDLDQQTWCSAGWACPGSSQTMDVDWVAEYVPN